MRPDSDPCTGADAYARGIGDAGTYRSADSCCRHRSANGCLGTDQEFRYAVGGNFGGLCTF